MRHATQCRESEVTFRLGGMLKCNMDEAFVKKQSVVYTAPSFAGPAWHPAVSSPLLFAFALSGTRGKSHRGQAALAVQGQGHCRGKSDAYGNTESPEPGGKWKGGVI